MNGTGRALSRRLHNGRVFTGRVVASLLLAAVALVPSLARTHDRLEQRTPAQQHSRFRWTNSCDSVPQKTTSVVVVAPVEGPAQ